MLLNKAFFNFKKLFILFTNVKKKYIYQLKYEFQNFEFFIYNNKKSKNFHLIQQTIQI